MASSIYYQVNELHAESEKFLSQVQSSDPFFTLCDFMIKAHCPVDYSPMRDSPIDPLHFETYPVLPDFAVPGSLNMGWTATVKETGLPHLITTINCIEIDDDAPGEKDFVHSSSIDRYRSENYVKGLMKLRERLLRWTEADLEVAIILAACSILDSSHPFWYENRPLQASGLRY